MQPHVRQVVTEFLARLDTEAPGPISVLLYGSAARREHVLDRSDLNLLLVAAELGPDRLVRLGRAFAPLEGRSRTPPLLFTEAEWRRSADVFPIEIVDMQAAREVLRGSDPVAGLEVSRPALRQALERELRGKLLRLRQGFAVHAGNDKDLARLGIQSAATVAALFRGALALAKDPVPASTPEMLRRAGTVMGLDPSPLLRYFELRTTPGIAGGTVGRAEFERYLGAAEIAVRFIDQFHVGGH